MGALVFEPFLIKRNIKQSWVKSGDLAKLGKRNIDWLPTPNTNKFVEAENEKVWKKIEVLFLCLESVLLG